MIRVHVIRPLGPADDPVVNISEEPSPADDVLRGRPGVNGTLLLWYSGAIEPVKVAVVDGVVGMPLEDLLDAVLVRAVPPKWSGSVVGLVDSLDALAELACTLTCNLARIQGVPDVMH